MNSINKLLLSTHLIKKAYAAYMPLIGQTGQISQTENVPKAIPVSAARLASPVPPAPVTISPYQPVLDVVRKGEAGVVGYNTMGGSNKSFDLIKDSLFAMSLDNIAPVTNPPWDAGALLNFTNFRVMILIPFLAWFFIGEILEIVGLTSVYHLWYLPMEEPD